MHATRFAILLVVGLCATQNLYASPFQGVEKFVNELIHKIQEAAMEFEKDVGRMVGEIRGEMQNIPKCAESEKPKVVALLNQTQQDAMECITKGMSAIQPASKNVEKIMTDLTSLIRKVLPGLIECQARGNAVTAAICVGETLIPVAGDFSKLIAEIRKEIPEVTKIVQNDLVPLFGQCSKKFQGDMTRVNDLVAELEKCIENSQS